MTLRLQDTVGRVQTSLALSDIDATIYVQLCIGGPAKASELAETLRLHRNDVYRAAERLEERGLVQLTLERPARYVAVEPSRVFDLEIDSRLAELEELKASREEVHQLLKALQAQAAAPQRTMYRVLQGRQEIYAEMRRMVDEAKSEIIELSTFEASSALRELAGITESATKRAASGVKVRVIQPSGARDGGLPPGAQVREVSADVVVRFIVVDDRELLMWVVNDGSSSPYARDEVAMLTTAQGLVQAERIFFEQTWASAHVRA